MRKKRLRLSDVDEHNLMVELNESHERFVEALLNEELEVMHLTYCNYISLLALTMLKRIKQAERTGS